MMLTILPATVAMAGEWAKATAVTRMVGVALSATRAAMQDAAECGQQQRLAAAMEAVLLVDVTQAGHIASLAVQRC